MSEFPKDVKITIDEKRYWEGLGRQDMDFHQVLGELIDNSISASRKDSQGDLMPFNIELTLQKIGNKILLKVADEGIGMSSEELEEHIFSLGGKGRSEGPLNEHGLGLKNALCVLTNGNKLPWQIETRDEIAVMEKSVYVVKGPFSSQMKICLGDINQWNKDLTHVGGDRGTRVYVETTFYFFNTLYRPARTFDTLVTRLIEHLGVMYRGFLKTSYNKLWLRWRDLGDNENSPNLESEWRELRIKAIEIPYDAAGRVTDTIEVDGPNGKAKATYIRGKLDAGKIKDESQTQEQPYPLKIYYQGNIRTQGIDLVVRGRVLKTGQLPEIWPDIPRHPNHNKFVGELILDDPKFRTVNNKTSLDPNNPYWNKLLDKLNKEERYKPQKITRATIEGDLAKKLKTMLEGLDTGSKVERDRLVWSGAGVKVDLYQKLATEEIHIYELKSGTATPIDAYQLLMYWDGVVKGENKSPTLGRLVAKDIPQSVKNIIQDINERKDRLGNPYKLEYKTIEELGLQDE